MKQGLRIVGVVGLAAVVGAAFGDDSFVYAGGNPRILTGRPRIHLESEKVKITIGPKVTKVTGAFVFVNEGRACTVRLGFPDQEPSTLMVSNPDSQEPATKKPKPKKMRSTMKSFKFFVDGKRVKDQLVKGAHVAPLWHVNELPFAAKQTRFVLDEYEVKTETYGGKDKPTLRGASYAMRTGVSWRGPIGKATVLIEIDPHAMPRKAKTLSPVRLQSIAPEDFDGWDRVPSNSLLYAGFAEPTVTERNILFVARDLRPGTRSDIRVAFATKLKKTKRKRGSKSKLPTPTTSQG